MPLALLRACGSRGLYVRVPPGPSPWATKNGTVLPDNNTQMTAYLHLRQGS